MAKLYREKVNQINIPTVAPLAPETKDSVVPAYLDNLAQQFIKTANENFILGATEATTQLVLNAYQQAPNNPAEFEKIFNAGYDKIVNKLPYEMRGKFGSRMQTIKQQYFNKTITNRDTLEENKRIKSIEDNFNSTKQVYLDATDTLMSAQQSGDAEQIKIATEQYANAKSRLEMLVNLTDSKGKAIFDKTTRESVVNGSMGKIEAFKNNIDSLTLEQLKEFDSNVFQNGEKYRQATNIDRKTYDQENTYVKARLKELGDEEERVVRSQAYFAAGQMINDFNSDIYKELQKSNLIPKDLLKGVVDVNPEKLMSDFKYNPNKATDANVLLQTIKETNSIINSGNLENGLRGLIDASKRIRTFGETYNVSPEKTMSALNTLNKSFMDKHFSDLVIPTMMKHIEVFDKSNQIPTKPRDLLNQKWIASPEQKRKITNLQEQMLGALEMASANGASAEELDKIATIFERQAVKTLYSHIADWDMLEKQKESGKPALFEYNGLLWQFNGFGTDTIFMEKAQ